MRNVCKLVFLVLLVRSFVWLCFLNECCVHALLSVCVVSVLLVVFERWWWGRTVVVGGLFVVWSGLVWNSGRVRLGHQCSFVRLSLA